MGPPYLSTLIYQYLAIPTEDTPWTTLQGKSIIIDANSFLYYIYDQMVLKDKEKLTHECLTNTPFMYEAYWQPLQKLFTKLKKCSKVTVIFDGVFKSDEDKRPDPDRTSSLRFAEFNSGQNRLPTLFRPQFVSILRKLEVDILVARGEADPMIANLARDTGAYVVAWDSDYHLYDLPHGYLPLRHLDLETLNGCVYQMKDVFPGMDTFGVALWTTIVAYNYITFEELERFLSNIKADDKSTFQSWLESTNPDDAKRQWLWTQWSTLRFIQQVGSGVAYRELIRLVSSDKHEKFNQIMSSYVHITQPPTIHTRNHNPLHSFLNRLFLSGDLDRAIIDILISREVLCRTQGNNVVYFELLLPIVQILLQWDCENLPMDHQLRTITYRGQTYDPLSMDDRESLPSLNEISKMSPIDAKRWVLYCVQRVLPSSPSSDMITVDDVHNDYVFWLCLVKLWYVKMARETPSKDAVLYAMIVSYLMQTLLNPDDRPTATQGHPPAYANLSIPSSPLLKRSSRKLKKYFSKDECLSFRQQIKFKSFAARDNDGIKTDLLEVEQFYHVLSIINQFFSCPLLLPTPRECINELCYQLAMVAAEKRNLNNFIRKELFNKNPILIGLLDEIQQFIFLV